MSQISEVPEPQTPKNQLSAGLVQQAAAPIPAVRGVRASIRARPPPSFDPHGPTNPFDDDGYHSTDGNGNPVPRSISRYEADGSMMGAWARAHVSPSGASQRNLVDSLYDSGAPELERETDWHTRITTANAQSLLPPHACLFVANLPSTRNDADLEAALRQVFEAYGPCWIKVRRGGRGMPMAFVQYEEIEHCERARVDGRGKLILDRPCRTEKGLVNRVVFVTLRHEQTVHQPEVHNALTTLQEYGSINTFWAPDPTAVRTGAHRPGLFVKYDFFDACFNACKALKHHNVFRFDMHVDQHGNPLRSNRSSRLHLRHRNVVAHQSAIYIGSLPKGTTTGDLLEIFSFHGIILEIIVKSKQKPSGMVYYAYLRYEQLISAQLAVFFSRDSLVLKGRMLNVDFRWSWDRTPLPNTAVVVTPGPLAGPSMYAVPDYALGTHQLASAGIPGYGWDDSNTYVPRLVVPMAPPGFGSPAQGDPATGSANSDSVIFHGSHQATGSSPGPPMF